MADQTMEHAKKIDKASGFFFFIGFALAQLRIIPVALVSTISLIASLFSTMIGYLLWITANLIYPDHNIPQPKWYNFVQLKEQLTAAAVIGLISVLFGAVAIVYPVAILPACWLLVVSNCLWVIGEYHKIHNPPPYSNTSSAESQKNYFYFSALLTSTTVLTALATTVSFIFPPATLIVFAASTLIGACLGGLAVYYWTQYALDEIVPKISSESYSEMAEDLGSTINQNQKAHVPDKNLGKVYKSPLGKNPNPPPSQERKPSTPSYRCEC